ncbi:3-(3-hydroxy-phenyl)propionate hydroxylase [Shimia gijangensis]|uniref:3-(3-hydroxy-phenyl)propionate hydroxylase n=2 Tax=Shimia gijangensis TaxID=1470563 RepID=A0A1M6JW03_9RHOB|nr:3-(3-hydroxy-phenyl)propionate hydroxylase [Shimia gijangensis]
MQTIQTDVAIVGYGPTGATLANLLAKCGVRVTVIERESAMYHLPRAVHFDDETMRVFQAAGIADDLNRKVRVNPGMKFVDPDGTLLLDWPRPQEIGPQGWHASYRLHQPDLEQLLRDRLASRAGVEVLTHTEVLSVQQSENSVMLSCRSSADGRVLNVRSKFVVGCDGAQSQVRGAIGEGMDDFGFDERWLVVDLLLKRDRPDLGNYSVQFCNPERPMTYCRSPGIRRRWEITVLKDETDAEVTQEAKIWQFLAPWIEPKEAELERSAVYTFRSAVAQHWRKGRLMIAGDAAHLTPPFMGQGMCAGIRDASNLAWKLALVVKGQASADLLNSYQAERAPNARAFIETAMRLGGLINSLDRESALKQAERNPTGGARMASIAPPLGPSSLPSLVDSGAPHQGQLFGQPVLRDGTLLDDVVGYRPVLILRQPLPKDVFAAVPVLDGEAHPKLNDTLDELGTNAVLIRPDKYIAASAITPKDIAVLAALPFPSPLSDPRMKEPAI